MADQIFRCCADKGIRIPEDLSLLGYDKPLSPGDKVVFTDMAHYTMVKTNTFNGLQLPSIATWEPETERLTTLCEFGYQDFKGRLS